MSEPFHLEFFVPGIPRPGGSKSGFPYKGKDGKLHVRMVDSSKYVKAWRKVVAAVARQAMFEGCLCLVPKGIPLRIHGRFVMPRPKSHYGTGRNKDKLKPGAPNWHTNMPDRGKLMRPVEDCLTGVVWHDDNQACHGEAVKRYPTVSYPEVGVHVEIEEIECT